VFRNAGGRGPISDVTGKPGFEESPEESGRAIAYTRPVRPGGAAPDIFFHFRIAAYLCGLGEIGYSKMFLTPDFGPLNRQAFIFSDAELEPDPLYQGPRLCNHCLACVQACPGQCLDRRKTVKVRVAGQDLEWGKLDEWKCFIYYEGANAASNPFLSEKAFAGRNDAAEILTGKKKVEPKEYAAISGTLKEYYPAVAGYNPPKCGGCLRACLNSLEKRGVLNKKFGNPFRTGKPWQAK
jgi:NAD-dependent dihydropyrimidine dehydrogenase PreA subunit